MHKFSHIRRLVIILTIIISIVGAVVLSGCSNNYVMSDFSLDKQLDIARITEKVAAKIGVDSTQLYIFNTATIKYANNKLTYLNVDFIVRSNNDIHYQLQCESGFIKILHIGKVKGAVTSVMKMAAFFSAASVVQIDTGLNIVITADIFTSIEPASNVYIFNGLSYELVEKKLVGNYYKMYQQRSADSVGSGAVAEYYIAI